MDESFMGVTEIASMLGVSKQRVIQLSQRESFPVPVATLASGRIWKRKDVEAWARHAGRRLP